MMVSITTALLIASAINLTLLIPGGFVENREFRTYPVWVIAAFNVFLTALGFGSLLAAYSIIQNGTGYGWAAVIGTCYVIVYVIDLAEWFPVSSTTMSTQLKTLEWAGTVLGGALLATALWSTLTAETNEANTGLFLSGWLVAAVIVLGIAVVIFSTLKALRK